MFAKQQSRLKALVRTFAVGLLGALALPFISACSGSASTEISTEMSPEDGALAMAVEPAGIVDGDASAAMSAMVGPINVYRDPQTTIDRLTTRYQGHGIERETLTIEIRSSASVGPNELAEMVLAAPPLPTVTANGFIDSRGDLIVITHDAVAVPPISGDDYGAWSIPDTTVEKLGSGSIATTVIEAKRGSRRDGGAIHQSETAAIMRDLVDSGPELVTSSSLMRWDNDEPWGLTVEMNAETSDELYHLHTWLYTNADGEDNYSPNEYGGRSVFGTEPRPEVTWVESSEIATVAIEMVLALDSASSQNANGGGGFSAVGGGSSGSGSTGFSAVGNSLSDG